jgi:hypothetical protein
MALSLLPKVLQNWWDSSHIIISTMLSGTSDPQCVALGHRLGHRPLSEGFPACRGRPAGSFRWRDIALSNTPMQPGGYPGLAAGEHSSVTATATVPPNYRSLQGEGTAFKGIERGDDSTLPSPPRSILQVPGHRLDEVVILSCFPLQVRLR